MNTINQRIEQIISNANITVKEFARIAGVPQTTLNEAATKNKDIRFSLIEKIYAVSDNIDANWILTGKGEMYKTECNAGKDNVNMENEARDGDPYKADVEYYKNKYYELAVTMNDVYGENGKLKDKIINLGEEIKVALKELLSLQEEIKAESNLNEKRDSLAEKVSGAMGALKTG